MLLAEYIRQSLVGIEAGVRRCSDHPNHLKFSSLSLDYNWDRWWSGGFSVELRVEYYVITGLLQN